MAVLKVIAFKVAVKCYSSELYQHHVDLKINFKYETNIEQLQKRVPHLLNF